MNQVAVIEFKGSTNLYDFKTDLELEIGDLVVCDTSIGYSLGTVVDLKDHSNKATKWIVCKVDLKAHEERLEKERRLKELKRRMDKRLKELEELEKYRSVAERDSEMANLLAEYHALLNIST